MACSLTLPPIAASCSETHLANPEPFWVCLTEVTPLSDGYCICWEGGKLTVRNTALPDWFEVGQFVLFGFWSGGVFSVRCNESGTPTGPDGIPMLLKTKRTAVMHRGVRLRVSQEYWYCCETGVQVQTPAQKERHSQLLDSAYARREEQKTL